MTLKALQAQNVLMKWVEGTEDAGPKSLGDDCLNMDQRGLLFCLPLGSAPRDGGCEMDLWKPHICKEGSKNVIEKCLHSPKPRYYFKV